MRIGSTKEASVTTSTRRPSSCSSSVSRRMRSRSVRPGARRTMKSTSLSTRSSPLATDPNSRTSDAPHRAAAATMASRSCGRLSFRRMRQRTPLNKYAKVVGQRQTVEDLADEALNRLTNSGLDPAAHYSARLFRSAKPLTQSGVTQPLFVGDEYASGRGTRPLQRRGPPTLPRQRPFKVAPPIEH